MPQHGEVMKVPEDFAGPSTCDWGDCDWPTAYLRFDAWEHGWLPVCAVCSHAPCGMAPPGSGGHPRN